MTQFLPLPPGVPFSWEKSPGVPRKQGERPSYRSGSGHRDSRPVDGKLLPPPAAPSLPGRKHRARSVMKDSQDPFLAAFVRCTRPHEEGSRGFWILRRNMLGGRGGVILTGGLSGHSCKRSCTVLDSVVYIGKTPAKSRAPSHPIGRSGYM
ncbi:hypothetical protein MLD38_024589 [Melastoma candidum]|uniref:Uncharacterized protein n=1 Tax=Melastoma candidum TaxID=119954 RepID=A0ACB9NSQ7_9MYRT|nr:hypothetical protein MLD38_024589 [Melastoma candidum]